MLEVTSKGVDADDDRYEEYEFDFSIPITFHRRYHVVAGIAIRRNFIVEQWARKKANA